MSQTRTYISRYSLDHCCGTALGLQQDFLDRILTVFVQSGPPLLIATSRYARLDLAISALASSSHAASTTRLLPTAAFMPASSVAVAFETDPSLARDLMVL